MSISAVLYRPATSTTAAAAAVRPQPVRRPAAQPAATATPAAPAAPARPALPAGTAPRGFSLYVGIDEAKAAESCESLVTLV